MMPWIKLKDSKMLIRSGEVHDFDIKISKGGEGNFAIPSLGSYCYVIFS